MENLKNVKLCFEVDGRVETTALSQALFDLETIAGKNYIRYIYKNKQGVAREAIIFTDKSSRLFMLHFDANKKKAPKEKDPKSRENTVVVKLDDFRD